MTSCSPDDLDPLLGDYFHAQRPTPWPPAHPSAAFGVGHIAARGSVGANTSFRPTRFSSATRSRLTLALSAGLVLAGGLTLTPSNRATPSCTAGTPATHLMGGAVSNGDKVIHDLDGPKKPPR